MDKRQSTKVKRQPLKVVYIGNPRMFKAKNYMEFRQIVQEFTAQNPETKTNPIATTITPKVNINMKDTVKENPEFVYDPPPATSSSATEFVNQDLTYPSSSSEYIDPEFCHLDSSCADFLDDFFTVEMLENYGRFM
ncbi:hypothetical protein ACHQM5_014409 [Ranunculus cassubicifolius]